MKIKTVEIGGKARPVHFGNRALAVICEELKLTLPELLFGKNDSPGASADTETVLQGHPLASLNNQLKVATIGLQEGQALASRLDGYQTEYLDEVIVGYWCDEDPEALERIFDVYREQVVEWAEKRAKRKVEEGNAKGRRSRKS